MMESVEHREDDLAEIDLTEDEIDAMMAAGKPVEIVGPPDRTQAVRFEVYRDSRRGYRWRLASSSGEVLATGDRSYATKKEAVRTVEGIMRSAVHAALEDMTGQAS